MAEQRKLRPSLVDLFAGSVLQGPAAKYVKRRLLGKRYIELPRLLLIGLYTYQNSALVGRARPQHIPLLLRMCSRPEDLAGNEMLAVQSKESAGKIATQSRLALFDGTPREFHDFYLTTEAAKIVGHSLPAGSGLRLLPGPWEMGEAKRIAMRKTVDVELVYSFCHRLTVEGLVLGAMYPQLVETMSTPDMDAWQDAWRQGLDMRTNQPMPLADLEHNALALVAALATQYYPELVLPLELEQFAPFDVRNASGSLSIQIERHYLEEIVAHASQEYPLTCRGVLAGSDGRVVKLWRATNSEHSATSLGIAPQELLAIYGEIESRNWDLYAVYCSQATGLAYPSGTTIRLAEPWPQIFFIIVSLQDRMIPVFGAFRIAKGQVQEVGIEVL